MLRFTIQSIARVTQDHAARKHYLPGPFSVAR